MKITFYGFIENNKIVTDEMIIERFFDPNGLVAEFNNIPKEVAVVINVMVSKKGKLISLIEDITPTT